MRKKPRRAPLPRKRRHQALCGCAFLLTPLEQRRLLSLTHLYTFNDGTPSDSIGGASGTLFNGAFISNGRLQLQNAGITSGSSATVQYAKLPNGILPASGNATLEAWYSTDSATPNWMRIFDLGTSSAGPYLFYTPKSSSTDSRVSISVSGTSATTATAANITYNKGLSTLVAVVVDSGADTLSLYINGGLISSVPLNGLNIGMINESNAYLGRSQFSSDAGFSGAIDEFRIYDEARTAENIAADAAAGAAIWTTPGPLPPRQAENLNRGIVAVPTYSQNGTNVTYTGNHIGWRLLATDSSTVAFNLYRQVNSGPAVKLNGSPISLTTDFKDTSASLANNSTYFVKPVVNGVEQGASASFTLPAGTPVTSQFLRIPLQAPAGGIDLSGVAYTYNANDASVADVDGDGQYEIILKWDPSDSKDNSQSGYTADTFIDCYRLDGTRLWRIDLGQNIRSGAHYTQFIAYDLDGDGKAEIAMRTAPGTIDGAGNFVLMGSDNPLTDYRNSSGYNLTSPEYLTIFNGLTGAATFTTAYKPDRGNVSQWGDSYGNRVDRLLMAVAYLDGQHPSLVIGRGIFGPQSGFAVRNEIVAYDYRNGQLTQRWWFKAGKGINNDINSNYTAQGTYDMIPADVDGDGKDEIIYGAMAIDDDGTPLYSTGLVHGDALHVSDMDPTRPGLEVFMPHEDPSSYGIYGGEYRDARTGQGLQNIPANNDVGRGVALEIDPNHPGFEFWATTDDPLGGTRMIYNVQDGPIYPMPSNMFTNFGIYWDADLESELLDGTTISDWNIASHGRVNIDLDPLNGSSSSAPGDSSNNGTKSTPCLAGDILGDWREEVIWRKSDNSALEIWTTPISATSRMVTLMQDIQYREAIAWQNVGYNQPPHPSFFIGEGMAPPPAPNIYLAPSLGGDANRDSHVTFADFLDLQNYYNKSPTTWEQGDFNADSSTTFSDFLILQNNYNQSFVPNAASINPSQSSIPALSPAVTPALTSPLATGLSSPALLDDPFLGLPRGLALSTPRPRRIASMPGLSLILLSSFPPPSLLPSVVHTSGNVLIISSGSSGFFAGTLHHFPHFPSTMDEFLLSGANFFIGWHFPM